MEQRKIALKENQARIMQNARRMIFVTFSKAGFHYYPNAANDEQLKDVSYLGNKHRHLFGFKIWIEVFHNDRELEFHQVLNFCESLFTTVLDINSKSVEMLSDDLFELISNKYPNRDIHISVSEDNECGAFIEYNKNRN